MLKKTQTIVMKHTRQWFGRNTKDLTQTDVAAARAYIAAYWEKLERFQPEDSHSSLGLPKPYLVPATGEGTDFDFNELYYWDSYFMSQGLFGTKHEKLAADMLENLESLFARFKTIPNASRTYLTGRSQPPLLTSFILDIFNATAPGLPWLERAIEVAKEEYVVVWMGTKKPNARQVYKGLSRYYDVNLTHDLAEAESGWDYNPRFSHQCLHYLPVDLNALLYKYEMDFARVSHMLGKTREATKWEAAAAERRQTMNHLMWSKIRGLYYDYNYVKGRQSGVESLAAYYPMWVGMVNDKQAKQLVRALRRFEEKGGLTTTDKLPLGKYIPGAKPMQWAYPNGWAPLHFIVVKALQRYGYNEDARRIAMKWLHTNLRWFEEKGEFVEKYNVVNLDKVPVQGVYPTQSGFGWTNAIFERFCQEFIDGHDPEPEQEVVL